MNRPSPFFDVRVTSAAADAIVADIVELHRAAGRPSDDAGLLRLKRSAAAIVAGHAPEVHDALSRLNRAHGPSVVRVSGLRSVGPAVETDAMRLVALALGAPLGGPFQYAQQNGGMIVPALAPQPDAPRQSGTSADPFGAHSDDAIVPPCFRTRHIALVGVTNEARAKTGYAPIDDVLARLDSETRRVLGKPLFRVRIPASHGWPTELWSDPLPLVYRNRAGEASVQCPTYNTRPLTERAAAAFGNFERAVEEAMEWTVIGPGDVDYFVFRNDRGLHARDRIAGERLLLRTYWRPNANALSAVTDQPGPVFDLERVLAA